FQRYEVLNLHVNLQNDMTLAALFVLADFLQKAQKKVSLYYNLSQKGSQIGVWRGIIFVKSR
ncbi:hypothetical protein ACT4UT_21480, partial [Bacillus sp. B-TM1]